MPHREARRVGSEDRAALRGDPRAVGIFRARAARMQLAGLSTFPRPAGELSETLVWVRACARVFMDVGVQGTQDRSPQAPHKSAGPQSSLFCSQALFPISPLSPLCLPHPCLSLSSSQRPPHPPRRS